MKNEFDNEIKYRLYRTINEILHPTISKKNISNYKIIINEEILPIRIFYPEKVSNLEKVIIYIHGNANVTNCTSKYSDICKKISLRTKTLVIALEYKDLKNNYIKTINDIYTTLKYIYHNLELNNILKDNIYLFGDSTSANIICTINNLNNKEINITKEVLFYPIINLDINESTYSSITKYKDFNLDLIPKINKYYKFVKDKNNSSIELYNPLEIIDKNKIPDTLIITGNIDILKDEAIRYYDKLSKSSKIIELPFLEHGFLKKLDKDVEDEIFKEVNNFLS